MKPSELESLPTASEIVEKREGLIKRQRRLESGKIALLFLVVWILIKTAWSAYNGSFEPSDEIPAIVVGSILAIILFGAAWYGFDKLEDRINSALYDSAFTGPADSNCNWTYYKNLCNTHPEVEAIFQEISLLDRDPIRSELSAIREWGKALAGNKTRKAHEEDNLASYSEVMRKGK